MPSRPDSFTPSTLINVNTTYAPNAMPSTGNDGTILFTYDPMAVLTTVAAPVVALVASDDDGRRAAALSDASIARAAAGLPAIREVRFDRVGHNVMRYRPEAVAAAILDP